MVVLNEPIVVMDADHHVHSTFSDGADSLDANLAAAEALGLRHLGCVDHVRRGTAWVASYVDAVHAASASRRSCITLTAGIEAKLLDDQGTLDVPPDYRLADLVYVADHQVPTSDGPVAPRVVQQMISDGTLTRARAVEYVVDATVGSIERYGDRPLVLAHLFSILPKMGIDESEVPRALIAQIARAATWHRVTLEVSERWRCPSLATVRVFVEHGVRIVASTDSHTAGTIGRYEYVRDIAAALDRA